MTHIVVTAIAIVLLVGVLAAESGRDFTSSTAWRCLVPPTEPCFTHRSGDSES
jgi:hypothetical protein